MRGESSLLFEPYEVGNPIANDAILPGQFWPVADGDSRALPEKRLMAAVLEEAICLVLSHGHRPISSRPRAASEAEGWIRSDDRSGPFTFVSICDVLGLEAGRIRDALSSGRLRKVGLARRRRLQAGQGRHRLQEARRRRK